MIPTITEGDIPKGINNILDLRNSLPSMKALKLKFTLLKDGVSFCNQRTRLQRFLRIPQDTSNIKFLMSFEFPEHIDNAPRDFHKFVVTTECPNVPAQIERMVYIQTQRVLDSYWASTMEILLSHARMLQKQIDMFPQQHPKYKTSIFPYMGETEPKLCIQTRDKQGRLVFSQSVDPMDFVYYHKKHTSTHKTKIYADLSKKRTKDE